MTSFAFAAFGVGISAFGLGLGAGLLALAAQREVRQKQLDLAAAELVRARRGAELQARVDSAETSRDRRRALMALMQWEAGG